MDIAAERPGPSRRVRVDVVDGGLVRSRADHVVTEEPLEVRLCADGVTHVVGVTMRTPGHDGDLAVGLLLAEGIVPAASAVRAVRPCVDPAVEQRHNVITVDVEGPVFPRSSARRPLAGSACGVCGAATLDDLALRVPPRPPDRLRLSPERLGHFPEALSAGQRVFSRTGGLHAAALADADGTALLVREDVGRHNAVDKVIGRAALDGSPDFAECVLVVSGRAGYEIVQKAVVAGVPVVVSVSAPSSLAVDVAQRFGVTLVGFARGDRAVVYSGAERVLTAEARA